MIVFKPGFISNRYLVKQRVIRHLRHSLNTMPFVVRHGTLWLEKAMMADESLLCSIIQQILPRIITIICSDQKREIRNMSYLKISLEDVSSAYI